MNLTRYSKSIFSLLLLTAFLLLQISATAADSDFPPKPNPPKAVNDFAGFMSADEQASLEYTLDSFEQSTTIAITIVTVKSLGNYDASDYTIQLGQRWGVGRGKEDNGVVVLASKDDHKYFIATGYGLEGAIPDILAGQIGRNEMVPAFKNGNYYEGFRKAINALIAASKGEYINTDPQSQAEDGGGLGVIGFVILLVVIFIIIAIISKGGGGGGGNYMSRRGSDFITGAILGGLLGGGGRSSGGSGWGGGFGGGSSGGGGGFGGFGGGGFGGGGAGGSW